MHARKELCSTAYGDISLSLLERTAGSISLAVQAIMHFSQIQSSQGASAVGDEISNANGKLC